MSTPVTRRRFVQSVSLVGVGYWATGGIAPAASKSANEKINIAIVGAGGQGSANTGGVSHERIVALCDVDERRAGGAFRRYPDAGKYKDFRKMLDEMDKQIDAVVISTPDHVHGPASIRALEMGKHVHCEKPLAHNVYECRLMAKLAREKGVVTQLGVEHNAAWHQMRAVELYRAGVIGKVREVHCGQVRPSEYVYPADLKPSLLAESGRPKDTPPVPAGLDWDLWLGPAPWRPYHPAYCPNGWRVWRDFGTGFAGNFGCHMMDFPFTALELRYPTSVEATGKAVPYERLPAASARFEFPARGEMPPVTLYWHDGGSGPPAELLEGETGTCLMIGEKGRILVRHAKDEQDPILLPKAKFRDVKLPETQLGDVETNRRGHSRHLRQFTNCIKSGGKTATDFANFGGPLGEAARLIHTAFYAGGKIEWDGENMRITNLPDANQYVGREYSKGWEL